jgi:hypothetical protein
MEDFPFSLSLYLLYRSKYKFEIFKIFSLKFEIFKIFSLIQELAILAGRLSWKDSASTSNNYDHLSVSPTVQKEWSSDFPPGQSSHSVIFFCVCSSSILLHCGWGTKLVSSLTVVPLVDP